MPYNLALSQSHTVSSKPKSFSQESQYPCENQSLLQEDCPMLGANEQ